MDLDFREEKFSMTGRWCTRWTIFGSSNRTTFEKSVHEYDHAVEQPSVDEAGSLLCSTPNVLELNQMSSLELRELRKKLTVC